LGVLAVLAIAAWFATLAATGALGQLPGPLNDLFALGQGGGDSPAEAQIQSPPEPPQTATARSCLAHRGDHVQPGVDGRGAGRVGEGRAQLQT